MTMQDPNKKGNKSSWGKFFNPEDAEAEKEAWKERAMISMMKDPMDKDVVELVTHVRELGYPIVEYSVNELEGVIALVVGRRFNG